MFSIVPYQFQDGTLPASGPALVPYSPAQEGATVVGLLWQGNGGYYVSKCVEYVSILCLPCVLSALYASVYVVRRWLIQGNCDRLAHHGQRGQLLREGNRAKQKERP